MDNQDNQQKPQVGQNDAEKRNIMVLGIVSLGLIVLCPPAGIVVGYIGKKKADEYKKNNGAEPESAIMSTIGFIVNIVLTAIGAVAMICMIAFGGLVFNSTNDTVDDVLDVVKDVKDEFKDQKSDSKNKSDQTDDSQSSSSGNSSSASTAECDIAKQSLSSTQQSVASAESAYNAIQSNSAATDAVKNQYKSTLDSLKAQLTQAQARVNEVCQ